MTMVAVRFVLVAVRFVLRSMLPSRRQLLIKGPKVRCSNNQIFSRSEDRANAKAATNRNGVVGNRGSTTPTAPIATAARPANNQMNRVSALTLAVHHTTTSSGKSGSTGFRQSGVSLLRYRGHVLSGQSVACERTLLAGLRRSLRKTRATAFGGSRRSAPAHDENPGLTAGMRPEAARR
jgi:hypothetical protein